MGTTSIAMKQYDEMVRAFPKALACAAEILKEMGFSDVTEIANRILINYKRRITV